MCRVCVLFAYVYMRVSSILCMQACLLYYMHVYLALTPFSTYICHYICLCLYISLYKYSCLCVSLFHLPFNRAWVHARTNTARIIELDLPTIIQSIKALSRLD